jgi:CBS-domain-containing membrane protein
MARTVWAVATDTDVETVAWLLTDRRISGTPVLDAAGRLAGVITKTDLVAWTGGSDARPSRRVFFRLSAGNVETCIAPDEVPPPRGPTVEELMSPFALTITPEASILDAARMLMAEDIHRLIVVDRGKVVGVVTPLDLLRALVGLLDPPHRLKALTPA